MFFKKKLDTPEALWAALSKAVHSGDGQGFAKLCNEHQEAIVAAFPAWQKPGKAPDPAAVQAHVQVLGHVAQYFAEALGRPELWTALTGGDRNPFDRWDAGRDEIAQRVAALDFEGAIARSRALLKDIASCSGDAADQIAEQVRGQMGQLLFHSGRVDESVAELETTLHACRKRGLADAVGIYLRTLHDVDRYAGRPSRWRTALADHLETQGDVHGASWLRRVGARYPEGEPILRMVTLAEDGRFAEIDEPLPSDRVQVVFERSRPTLALAERWIARGREHATSGDIEGALACYTQAAEADPHDPQSRYQQAFLSMLADRADLALPLYESIEALAPGWFHARTWRSLAERRIANDITQDVVLLVDRLEDGGLPPEARLDAAQKALVDHPRVPELHFYRARALAELGRDPERALLAGLEVAEGNAIRSRLLFELGRFDDVLAIERPNLMCFAAATIQLRSHGNNP